MSAHPCKPYHVCATVNRSCLGMLLLRSICAGAWKFLGEITGESLGDTDFLEVLDFSCCSRFSARGFHKILVQPGVWTMRIIHFGDQGVRACRLLSHFSRSTLYTWQWSGQRGCLSFQWLPRSGSRGEVGKAGRGQPLLVHSAACLSLSAETGLGAGGERTPAEASRAITPPLMIPCQGSPPSSRGRGTWREAGERGFYSNATKQPAKLLELMRRSCSSDFCLCT